MPLSSKNESKFNGVYSKNNLAKTKDWELKINLDEFKSIRNKWIVLSVNPENVTYFDRFGVEHFSKEIEKFIENKNYNNKYLCNTINNMRFKNMRILFFCIY